MKNIVYFVLILFSINSYSQNNKDSLEYINYFLKSTNYWGNISGYLTEVSTDIFNYQEHANFNDGKKNKWEVNIFSQRLNKIVVNQTANGEILFFDFYFNYDVTVYNKEIVNYKEIETEEERNKITIRIDKKISNDECETLKLAFKLLFKGIMFEEKIF